MINRIVRMSFQQNKVEEFLEVFNESKIFIASSKGCNELKLLRDVNQQNVFFTYSVWDNEEDLNAYRHSDLFDITWSKTKILFNDKPQAWSTIIFDSVK